MSRSSQTTPGIKLQSMAGSKPHCQTKENNDNLEETCRTKDVVSQIVELKREIGLLSGISFIVGAIVGSGIFISPKGVLEATGSVGLSLIVWVGAGIITLMGGLCYCELGTMIPKSGGEYTYIRTAFGDLPAFLNAWVFMLLASPTSMAVKALTFGTYLSSLFHVCGKPKLLEKLMAILCLVTIMLLNMYSSRMSARVQIATTLTKMLSLVVIILGGVYRMANGHTAELKGFSDSSTQPSSIALAFYDALWAYSGWRNLNNCTEELRNPSKNLPRSIIISVLTVVVIYVLTNIAYFTAMTKSELLAADAVAMLWGDRVLSSASIIIPLTVVISTFGSANASAFVIGRSVFAAARDGSFPEVFSFINVTQLTPLPSTFLTMTLAIIFILLGDISSLINFFSFSTWIFYGMTFSSLIYFRIKWKDAPRPYRVPIIIPIIMILVSIYLVIAPIIQDPAIELIYAALFILGGIIFYVPFIYFKMRIPFCDQVTLFLQLVWQVVPSTQKDGFNRQNN